MLQLVFCHGQCASAPAVLLKNATVQPQALVLSAAHAVSGGREWVVVGFVQPRSSPPSLPSLVQRPHFSDNNKT
jgi:hypothetical protein